MADVFCYGAINQQMVYDMRKSISHIPKHDCIELHVSSPGGILGEGITAYNILRSASQEVHVTLDGDAFSAATLLVCAADYVDMPSNCLMMVHEPWVPSSGPIDLDEANKIQRYLSATLQQCIEIYADKTGQARDKIAEWMKQETYFDAHAALDVGFASNVIEASREVQNRNIDDYDAQDKGRLAKLLADRPLPRTVTELAAKFGVTI